MIKIENVKIEKEENNAATMYAEITAPLYWWDKFDKCVDHETVIPMMSRIMTNGVTFKDFSTDSIDIIFSSDVMGDTIKYVIDVINKISKRFVEVKANEKDGLTKRKALAELVRQVEQLMPKSYNVTSKVVLDYEQLSYLYKRYRNNFNEWHVFCEWVKTLPNSETFIFNKGE